MRFSHCSEIGRLRPFLSNWRLKNKEDITMISKEKKTAIIKEYARTEGDTGSGAYRALERESKGSSLKKRSFENGWSEKRFTCLLKENRY